MSEAAAEAPAPEIPPRRSKLGAILFTVVGLAAIAGLVAMPYLAGQPNEFTVSQWGKFLGRFHPVFLHLPIGMLALVILIEFGKLFRRDKGNSTLVPMFFTAGFAVLASIFGFLLYQGQVDDYPEELVESHLWWGIGFAAATILAFVVKYWVDAAGKGGWVYFLMLLGTGGLMAVASHDGGSLTHGTTYLTDHAPNEVREVYNKLPGVEPLEIREEPEQGAAVVTIPPEERVVYEAYIQPIFDQKCVSCHGPDKQKGSMRMDSYELTLEGGKEGEGFEPGSAEDSSLVFRIELPEDDDEHMPPEGKKQVEPHELALISWWIDSGASPTATLGELEVTPEIEEAIGKVVPAEVLEAQKQAAEAAQAAETEARAALASSVEQLQEVFPSALNFESQESSGLTFTAVSMRKDFNDEQLAKLEPLVGGLVSVDLSATTVTDEGLRVLEGAESLRTLRLAETGITDASMELLAGLPALESLNLYGTAVTREGVAKLAVLPNLKSLYLWQTQVDEAGAAELREQMPDTEIVLGIEVPK